VDDRAHELTRRRLLLRGAAAAGAAVWVPPLVESLTAPAAAGEVSPPPCKPEGQPCNQPGECCCGNCFNGKCGGIADCEAIPPPP
jgi:hypothetical protein